MRFCGLFDDEGKKQFLLKIPQQLVNGNLCCGQVKKQGNVTDMPQFCAQLDALGLKILQVTADGNCFFRSAFIQWPQLTFATYSI
jgi:hypothetical protein